MIKTKFLRESVYILSVFLYVLPYKNVYNILHNNNKFIYGDT